MKSLFAFTLGLLLTSCSYFEQNDFLATEYIGQVKNETFFYSAYQTGIDNYRIEFKVAVNQDTSKIFDYYINDAIYSREGSFLFKIAQDTLVVTTPHQYCKYYRKTKKGTTIIMTPTHKTEVCED